MLRIISRIGVRTLAAFSFLLLICCQANKLDAQDIARRFDLGSKNFSAKITEHRDYPQMCLEFEWEDSTADWDSSARVDFVYDINGHVLEQTRAKYSGGQYVNQTRNRYAYTAEGWLAEEVTYDWNINVWDSVYRATRSYDSLGNLLQFWVFAENAGWDTTGGEQHRYTYRTAGGYTSDVSFQWNLLAGWLLVDSAVYHFSQANVWDTITYFGYSGIGWHADDRVVDLTWHNFSKEFFLTASKQAWAGTDWEYTERQRASYGPHDSQTIVYDHYTNSVWDSVAKEESIYDAKHHLTEYGYYVWQSGWNIASGEMNQYTYDLDGHTVERVVQYHDGTAFENAFRFVYNNFFVGNSPGNSPEIALKLFPNPASETLNIMLPADTKGPIQFALFDMAGRLRMATQFPRAEAALQLELPSSLEAGQYSYRILTGKRAATGKIVLVR